ncbi:unnamed protein product [Peniophora sp. CBMAI 1063]|nr:unnamed protein product [Peniophora sp. CBMAI 1063]
MSVLPVPDGHHYEKPGDFIWDTYLKAAKAEDEVRPKNWEGSTTGILTFTGLFAATVATFIVESYALLSPDPSDRTNALLEQLFVAMANASSQAPITIPPVEAFSAPPTAVVTNVFWFSSLLIALICALLATLVQEWSRAYVQDINRRQVFHDDIRTRALNHIFIRMGVNRYGMDQFVSWIVALMHLSVLLFACGLLAFLFPIDHIVAGFATGVIAVFLLIYNAASMIPLLDKSCPYRTPASYMMAFACWLLLHIPLPTTGSSAGPALPTSRLQVTLHDIITRKHPDEAFISRPHSQFIWESTYPHIDQGNDALFLTDLPSFITMHVPEDFDVLLSRMFANFDLSETLSSFFLRLYREGSSSLSAPIDSEILRLVMLLGKITCDLEGAHYRDDDGKGLNAHFRVVYWMGLHYRQSANIISRIADANGPSSLSASACLTSVRWSLIGLCFRVLENKIPIPDEEEVRKVVRLTSSPVEATLSLAPHTLLLLFAAGTYPDFNGSWYRTGGTTLLPLHDDDCCTNWRHTLDGGMKGLAHMAACNLLTMIARIFESTTEQRDHATSLFTDLSQNFRDWVPTYSLTFRLLRDTGKRKPPSEAFVSMLHSAGLDAWLEPGSSFEYTPPTGLELGLDDVR